MDARYILYRFSIDFRSVFVASNCIYGFLHFYISALESSRCPICSYGLLHSLISVVQYFCICICLPPYSLHLLCISAFLHFCIARLLKSWIYSFSHVKMGVFLHLWVSALLHFRTWVFPQSYLLISVGIAKRNKKRLIASDVPRSFSHCGIVPCQTEYIKMDKIHKT